jgi:pSer/pThr/pTyr-binding forkhead associated (FHA) protein
VAAPVARLIAPRTDGPDRVHALGLGVHRLGRGPGVDLVVDHPDVSRSHAELEVFAEGLVVRDLGSKNGVRVGGHRVGSAVLADGSVIELGGLVLVVEHPRARVLGLVREAGEPTLRSTLAPRSNPGLDVARSRPGVDVAQSRPGVDVARSRVGLDVARSRSGLREGPSVLAPALACLAFTVLLAVLLGTS